MTIDHFIVLAVGVLGGIAGLFLLREARKTRAAKIAKSQAKKN